MKSPPPPFLYYVVTWASFRKIWVALKRAFILFCGFGEVLRSANDTKLLISWLLPS